MSVFDILKSAANTAAKNAINKTKSQAKNEIRKTVNQTINNAVSGDQKPKPTVTKKIIISSIPKSVEELKSAENFDLKDPYSVAAYCIAAFCVYPENRDATIEMLNYMKGPQPVNERDKQFIRDRFMDGAGYIPRSYFEGATPENNYTPQEPYEITIHEFVHSRDQKGYLKVWMKSGGADSERFINLRTKESTGEWFIWDFESVLMSMRKPKEQDAWA